MFRIPSEYCILCRARVSEMIFLNLFDPPWQYGVFEDPVDIYKL